MLWREFWGGSGPSGSRGCMRWSGGRLLWGVARGSGFGLGIGFVCMGMCVDKAGLSRKTAIGPLYRGVQGLPPPLQGREQQIFLHP